MVDRRAKQIAELITPSRVKPGSRVSHSIALHLIATRLARGRQVAGPSSAEPSRPAERPANELLAQPGTCCVCPGYRARTTFWE